MAADSIVPIDHIGDLRIKRIDPSGLLLVVAGRTAPVGQQRSPTPAQQESAQRSRSRVGAERLVESVPKHLDGRPDALVHLLEQSIDEQREGNNSFRNVRYAGESPQVDGLQGGTGRRCGVRDVPGRLLDPVVGPAHVEKGRNGGAPDCHGDSLRSFASGREESCGGSETSRDDAGQEIS